MAQHDYIIANDTAANVRADINNALAAIASQNSGASAPSTTYANMIWYDSANNLLKMRDEADAVWITLGELDQAGSKFNPSANLVDPVITGTPVEDIYALSGTTPTLEPDNGSIQTHTLTGNTTYSDGFSAGQAVTLMIDDGAARTVTWPTMTWVNNGGTAPTLATSGYTVVALWKVGSTLYGALVGDGS